MEELLRVNAELAAEIRSLNLGRRDLPRAARVPAARQIAQLTSERDEAREQLRVVTAERDALQRHRAPLEAEVARLRRGLPGFLRRARARLRL
jgi:cell division protein FtsB